MYKAILFDLDNTLLNYNQSEQESMKKSITKHKILHQSGVSWDSFWMLFSAVNTKYWEERHQRKLNHLQVLEFSFQDTFAELGIEKHAMEVVKTYWNLFCHTCHFEVGASEILNWIQQKYNMGIISNGIGEAQRKRLLAGDIHHYFDSIVISDEIGYWKPDPNIFETALDQLNVDRAEVLFIGDSIKDDYQGAIQSGIDFCFYNRKNHLLEDHIKPKHVINELVQLKTIL